jgi:sigma-B regulation protein RsbU (phosphoserine phosphatase)
LDGPDPDPAPLVEESLEDLYEHAPCGYVSTRLDGTIIRANATFLSWTGLRAEDVVGQRRLQDLLTPGGRIFYETHYAPLLRMQGHVREIAVDIVCADGRVLPVLMNSVLRPDESGTPRISRTVIFDATERRSYEQELLRAKRDAEESEARARVLAAALQQSFIPPAPPDIAGLDVAGAYRPAGLGDQVGGDFYDVFETGRDDWALVVGDVCGKGPEAAAVTALARYTLRAAAMRTRRPKHVLATLNQALLQQHAERFCTVVYARLRNVRGRWQVTVSSGGHPLPVHLTATGVAAVGRPGDLLGVLDEPLLHDVTFDLRPDEMLVFFTDGVIEARAGRDFYGDDRLVKLLTASPRATAAHTAAAIEADVVAFQNGFPRDDIAVVVVGAPSRP